MREHGMGLGMGRNCVVGESPSCRNQQPTTSPFGLSRGINDPALFHRFVPSPSRGLDPVRLRCTALYTLSCTTAGSNNGARFGARWQRRHAKLARLAGGFCSAGSRCWFPLLSPPSPTIITVISSMQSPPSRPPNHSPLTSPPSGRLGCRLRPRWYELPVSLCLMKPNLLTWPASGAL